MIFRSAWIRTWTCAAVTAFVCAGCTLSSGTAPRGRDDAGTAEAVLSNTTIAPRMAGQPSNLIITRLVGGGSRVRAGDVLVEFDRQDQIRVALGRRAGARGLRQPNLQTRGG